jgi:hypothetical protein
MKLAPRPSALPAAVTGCNVGSVQTAPISSRPRGGRNPNMGGGIRTTKPKAPAQPTKSGPNPSRKIRAAEIRILQKLPHGGTTSEQFELPIGAMKTFSLASPLYLVAHRNEPHRLSGIFQKINDALRRRFQVRGFAVRQQVETVGRTT